jgi:Holliday junction resolvasome RuvABC endonuclease subunit
MVVRCIAAHQLRFCLLSHLLSSLAAQALNVEEPFISTIQTVVNVFYIRYAVMIVTHHTQVRMAFFHTHMLKMML